MIRAATILGAAMAVALSMVAAAEPAAQPKPQLNTLKDVVHALQACWRWPPESQAHPGMELTIRVSFKRGGEVFGAKLTFQSHDVSDEERAVYYKAMIEALARCSPLPLSETLGEAIAGRPFWFHINDTRQQRKA